MINPTELKKLHTYLPALLLFAVILCFVPSMLIEPEQASLNGRAAQYGSALNKLKGLKRQKLKYIEQAQLSKRLKEENDKFLSAAVCEEAIPNIISDLHKMAAECCVVIENGAYSLFDKYEDMQIKNYELKLELHAEYEGLHRMLEKLEAMPMPIVISGITLADNQNYSITMRLMVK